MTDLRVHICGEPRRPPLVLVHGLTEAGTAWPDAVARWAGDWHLYAVDLRGHGESPRFTPPQLARMFDTFVEDVITVLEGMGPAAVVGHSLGGRVAAAVAVARPDLVRTLVLEDPALTQGTSTPPGFTAEQHRFLELFTSGGDAERERMARESTWVAAEIDRWAECKSLVDRAMIDHLDLGDLDASDVFAALRVPTLVLYDGDGPLARHCVATDNPLVDIRLVDGVGHCIRRDDPATFHAHADPWLLAHGCPAADMAAHDVRQLDAAEDLADSGSARGDRRGDRRGGLHRRGR